MSESPHELDRSGWSRDDWLGAICLCVGFPAFCLYCWFYPAESLVYRSAIVAVGMAFDLFSAVCYIATLVTRRHSSGVPVAWLFYSMAWIATPNSVLLPTPDDLATLWVYKALDLVAVLAAHSAFHRIFYRLIRLRPPLPYSGDEEDDDSESDRE